MPAGYAATENISGLSVFAPGGGAKSIEDLADELELNKTISKTCANAARGYPEDRGPGSETWPGLI